MSIRGKDVRAEIDEGLHQQLAWMAEFADQDISRFASRLLSKAIVGEWHEFSILQERMQRCGRLRKGAELP